MSVKRSIDEDVGIPAQFVEPLLAGHALTLLFIKTRPSGGMMSTKVIVSVFSLVL